MNLNLIAIIIYVLNINLIKSEELITPAMPEDKQPRLATPEPALMPESLSTTLETLMVPETSSFRPSNNEQAFITEHTPSWELIYPEQNSTTFKQPAALPYSTTIGVPVAAVNLPKYFKGN